MKVSYFICSLMGCIGLALTGITSNNTILHFFCNLIGFILFGASIIKYIDSSIKKEEKEIEKELKKYKIITKDELQNLIDRINYFQYWRRGYKDYSNQPNPKQLGEDIDTIIILLTNILKKLNKLILI